MRVQKTDKLVCVVLRRGSGQGDEMFADRLSSQIEQHINTSL